MKIINLLPKTEQRQIKLESIMHQMASFWAAILISVVILIGLIFASQFYLRAETTSVGDQILAESENLKTADTQVLEKQVKDLNQQLRLIDSVKKQHYEWSKILIELDKLLPSDLTIALITLERETGQVVLTGSAENRDSVLKFWSNVKKSTMFRDIDFPLANLEKPTDSNFTFTLTINEEAIKAQ